MMSISSPRRCLSRAGQYFPRPLIKAMVEVTKPELGQTIHDPACGTGGFLIRAHNYISQNCKLDKKQKEFLKLKTLNGNDIVGEVVRLCAMNLFLHGIGGETKCPIRSTDSLRSLPSERFDFVLTNPPFGKKSSFTIDSGDGNLSKEADSYTRDDFWATTSNKQLNFLQHVHSVLKIGGKAAVVVPDNVLFEGGAGEVIRKKLLDTCDVHTILRLPTGIFYARVKANVIFFDKKEDPRDIMVLMRFNKNLTTFKKICRERRIPVEDEHERTKLILILTAHSLKGKETKHVFVLNVNAGR